jgi:acylphosphatase
VQGVFFRAATRDQARLLGLTGWVRNLPDGRVEVQAFGEEELLESFRQWLKRGPDLALVLKLECGALPYQEGDGFSIR